MNAIQRKAVRKRLALERAVCVLRMRFDELQRVRPDVNAYMDLIDRSLWGNRDATRKVRAIKRAERRYERQRTKAKALLSDAERAIAGAASQSQVLPPEIDSV